jgi:pyrroloquinoline quinone (PQQ) biosynthesis protein C
MGDEPRFVEFAKAFRSRVNQLRYWKHPFFEYAKSHPSHEPARAFVVQFGKGEAALPGVLSAALRNPRSPKAFQHVLTENIRDETGGGHGERSHMTLLERCLDAIGSDSRTYAEVPPTAGADAYLALLRRAAEHRDPNYTFGILAVEEVSNVGEFGKMLEILEARGFSGPDLQYVRLHIHVDVDHADALLTAVGELAGYDFDHPTLQLALQEYEMVSDWFYDSLMRDPSALSFVPPHLVVGGENDPRYRRH